MLEESTKKWLATLTLSVDTQPLADLALMLAARYDEKRETSTAGELRKTMNEIRSMLATEKPFDPLEELLTR